MSDQTNHPESFPGGRVDSASAHDSGFPKEPFECPYCGQMLAAACRVCVACKRAINSGDIRFSLPAKGADQPQEAAGAIAPVRFSWPIFFTVFATAFLVAAIIFLVTGQDREKTQLLLSPIPLISALWVIFDGNRNHVSKPLRWGLGALFLWIVFFPWYLARRRTPAAPCPFVEGRGMLLVLLLVLAVNLLYMLIIGPGKQ